MGKRKLLLATCILFIQAVFAQDKCSCSKATKLRPVIGKYFNSGKLDSAEYILTQLAGTNEDACTIVYLDGIAQVNIAKKQFRKGRQLLQQEYLIQLKLNCKKTLIRYYNTMARYYQETGYSDSLTATSLKVIELAEEEKDWYAAARACTNLASTFAQEKQPVKSLQYYQQALPFARLSKDTVIIAAVLTRTADNYFTIYATTKNKNYLDSLFIYAAECITISQDHPANLMELSDAYSNMGKYYLERKEYNKAIAYGDSAIVICPKGVYDFSRHILNGYQRKAEAFFAQQNFAAAKTMADSAYYYATQFNIQLAVAPLQIIYESAKQISDFKQAVWAHERMTTINDSIFSVEKNAAINELEKKYSQAKNEKTIKELAQQKQIYLLLALAGFLGLVAIAFWIRQQSLKNKQKIMETEQRLNRARMNPHFFFNALATLHSFAVREKDTDAIASNLSKFSHIMRETLESTYKEYVTVEEEIAFLNEYLDVQKIHFHKKFIYEVAAKKNVEADEVIIPSMIIQPFVENSIEHGFGNIDHTGEIKILFTQTSNSLQIEIADNGSGLIAERKDKNEHVSRASQIIKDRIYLLNVKHKTKASFSINNAANGKGVLVKINLPLLYINDI